MSFVSSGENTGSPLPPQPSGFFIYVDLLTAAGAITGRIGFPAPIGDIISGLIKQKLSPEQDTKPTPSLRTLPDSPEVAEQKAQNRRFGRLIAAETRRRQKLLGETRELAMRNAAAGHSRTFSEAELLVKLHYRTRAKRIDRLRAGIIARALRDGLTNREVAERLHVSPQHVGRIIAELEKVK